MNAIVGKNYSLRFDFLSDGEYVVPDVGSVTYTVYDNTGLAIAGQTSVAVTTNTSTDRVTITVPLSAHTVAVGKSFEQRSLQLDYTLSGKTQSIVKHYYVTPWLNHRVTPEDVISCLSIKEGEIFFEEVEIVPAYFMVRNTLGASIFDAALVAGDVTQIKLNDAIKYQAALKFLATLELRTLEKVGGDSASFKRFATVDFEAVKKSLRGDLESALGIVASGAVSIIQTPTVFVLSNPSDLFTG